MNFQEMGIERDSILEFIEDNSITITVVNNKKISYNGEEMSLTRATKEILQLDYAVQPAKYWLYNGKSLKNLYEETYSLDSPFRY